MSSELRIYELEKKVALIEKQIAEMMKALLDCREAIRSLKWRIPL